MLKMNDLKAGVTIQRNGEPFEILEAQHTKTAQRRPVMQTKLRNLKSNKVLSHTFQQSDKVAKADVEKREATFAYRTRDAFFFVDKNDEKTECSAEFLGEKVHYLTKDLPVTLVTFADELISVELPIKVALRVTSAPPSAKGNTAQGGTKDVTLETGGVVKTPLFIQTNDTIEVNTETGEYSRRINE